MLNSVTRLYIHTELIDCVYLLIDIIDLWLIHGARCSCM